MYPFICPHRNDGLYDLCYLYFTPSQKYPNEQYNIENFGVLMCPLSILIFFFFFFLGPFGVPLGRLAHLIKNSPHLPPIFLDKKVEKIS